MNYLHLINNFWRLNLECGFTAIETQLYFKLLDSCNSFYWKNPFKQSNAFLCSLTGMSEPTLIKARASLKEHGLIDFTSGKQKREPTEYTIVDKITPKWSANVAQNDSSQELAKSDEKKINENNEDLEPKNEYSTKKSLDNNKQNKNKNKKKKKEESIDSSSSEDDKTEIALSIINKYNRICKELPRAVGMSNKRKKMVLARLDEYGADNVLKMLKIAADSHFLNGYNENCWKASFDWLFRPDNFLKVLEDSYTSNF